MNIWLYFYLPKSFFAELLTYRKKSSGDDDDDDDDDEKTTFSFSKTSGKASLVMAPFREVL